MDGGANCVSMPDGPRVPTPSTIPFLVTMLRSENQLCKQNKLLGHVKRRIGFWAKDDPKLVVAPMRRAATLGNLLVGLARH